MLVPDRTGIARLADRLSGRAGVIVCGGGIQSDGFAAAVDALATALACPVFADPHSGLRWPPRAHLCVAHERWLRDAGQRAALRPAWVLRFGEMPVANAADVHGRLHGALHRDRKWPLAGSAAQHTDPAAQRRAPRLRTSR